MATRTYVLGIGFGLWMVVLVVETWWFRRDIWRHQELWVLILWTWFGPIGGQAALLLLPQDANPLWIFPLMLVYTACLLAHVNAVRLFAKARAANR